MMNNPNNAPAPMLDLSAVDEAERLRTGIRALIRDWAEGWEDCDRFDQRIAYQALGDLLGPDFDNAPTWVAPVGEDLDVFLARAYADRWL